MDPEIFKQRQAFMKKARENAGVVKAAVKPVVKAASSPSARDSPSVPFVSNHKNKKNNQNIDFRNISAPNNIANSKFALQTRFIKYMKERHLQGESHPLTAEEALDEMNERNTPVNLIKWLVEEALPKNPKIEIVNDRYKFKPKYDIRSRRELRTLIEEHFRNGKGNISLNEIKECYMDAEKHVNKLNETVNKFIRSTDKEVVLGYNHSVPGFEPLSDKDKFRLIFHSINIDNIPNQKMEDFLKTHEFGIVNGESQIANNSQLKRPGCSRRKRKFKLKSNAHLESLLKDYDK